MRIICLAYHLIGYEGVRYFLEEAGDELVAVFTHQDAPGEEIWWPSVAELASSRGVPVHMPPDINDPQWVEHVRALRPDFIFSFWYRQLLGRSLLQIPRGGCLNLHGSLLPAYRGRSPVNWVLVNGEKQTGLTLHYMVQRPDAGDVVAQAIVPIDSTDTALSLYQKMAALVRVLLGAAWPLLREGRAPRFPQDESKATYFGRRTPEDGCFAWEWPALRIHNLVRAVTHPYPGAFTYYRGKKLYVWAARPLPGLLTPYRQPPGTVQRLSHEGLEVVTGEGNLLIKRAQLEGNEEMTGDRFASRYGIEQGHVLQ